MWTYNCSYELYHHGIQGQKWGIRRYQNPDGTLTAAGRHRAKQGIRAKYTAENAKKGAKNSMTKFARERNQKRYDKKHAKYESIKKELGEKAMLDAQAKITKFRSNLYSIETGFASIGRYSTLGTGILASVLNPLNAPSVYAAYVSATASKDSFARSRNYYKEEYDKTVNALEKQRRKTSN